MKKGSMEEHVYHHIRTAILSRTLAPGKQLIENNISNVLGVSRTPIRNAIKKLSDEGLVDLKPNRGAFVTNPTKDEIIQAYELRYQLEYLAVCEAMENLNKTDFEEIRNLIEEERRALYSKNSEEYVKANKEFHVLITRKCNNKFLNAFINQLINQTNIYLILFDDFFSNPEQEPYSPDEHLLILSLIENKKKAELKNTLEHHFKHAISSMETHYNRYKELDEIF